MIAEAGENESSENDFEFRRGCDGSGKPRACPSKLPAHSADPGQDARATPGLGFPRFRERRIPAWIARVLLAFHKPYGVLSQFTPEPGSAWRVLADFGMPPEVYPLGRLDADSEGLLLLTDEKELNARLLEPRRQHPREYWVQVERVPAPGALSRLERGVMIGDYRTLPCRARSMDPPPAIAPRDPPVRFRKNVPDAWIALELVEGKNRQVRRMTAAVGHPTLRLIRMRIGRFHLGTLEPGKWRTLTDEERAMVFV